MIVTATQATMMMTISFMKSDRAFFTILHASRAHEAVPG
jgi:hypothetical protein